MIPKDELGSIRLRLAHIEEEVGLGGVAHGRPKHRREESIVLQLQHIREEICMVEHRLSKRIAALEAGRCDPKAWNRGDEPTESVRTTRKPGAE